MWHHNVELLAYHDLDGRSGFKLALQEIDGHFFLYVAGFWHSGWSILEVTDPEHPELLRFLDGPPNTMTLQVQVADGMMITGLEHPFPGLPLNGSAKPQDGFLIWDVNEPDRPQLLGRWLSGETGTHRNFYNGGRWVYATSTFPGFEGHILAIVDIEDPTNPKVTGKWWYPGQHKAAGESYTTEEERRLTSGHPFPGEFGLGLHGGAYVVGDRAYCPWKRAGMVILDVSDKSNPKHVSTLSVYPPLGSTIAVHSAVPLVNRDVVVINSEALQERGNEAVDYVATVDISDESDPMVMAVFPPPRPPHSYSARSFAEKGGRFGPHNQHQQQGLDCLAPNDPFVYLAYFNAGLQIYDVSDPRDPFIDAYYIPDDPKQRIGPVPSELAHQAEDVLVDRRGVIYMSEANSGIYIFDHQHD
jgi:hypothetical protein